MDISGVHLWLVLWRAYEACQTHARCSIESLSMCYSDFVILECLLHKGPLPVNTIGQKISLTSGSITTAIDRLENRGLVERRDCKNDRRAKIVYLTAQGKKLIKDAFHKHKQDMEQIAKSLSETERQTLLKLVKKFGQSALIAVNNSLNAKN